MLRRHVVFEQLQHCIADRRPVIRYLTGINDVELSFPCTGIILQTALRFKYVRHLVAGPSGRAV